MAETTFRTRPVQQVSRTGEFDLACNADTAFPLFSPEGERDWVSDWNPRPVFPETTEFRRDTVFRQGNGKEDAVWTIVDADWQTHRAEYVRVAPASHAAHIVVKVGTVGPGCSHVAVSYTITPLGEHAASLLDAFSESAFAAKMRNWRQQISEHLEKSKRV